MSEVSGKALDINLLQRVLAYVKPYKTVFILTGVLTLVLALLGPVRPYLIEYTIDNFVVTPNNNMLTQMTILMIVLLVVESGFQFIHTYYANWIGQSVIKDLRMDVFRKINNFNLKYFDNNPIGTLVTRAISDIETISNIFSEGILIIIGDILKLIAVVAFMFYTDWRLTLLVMIPIPILFIATNMFKNAIKSAFQDVRNEVAALNAFVQEHIVGINLIQIFNREEIEYNKFTTINARHRDAHIRSVFAYSVFFPVVEILSAISIALLIWWGSREVLNGAVTFGNLVAFILYIYMLYRPIRMLADRFNTLQMGMVSSERVFAVLDTQSKIENTGTLNAENIQGNIEIKNVWFAYNEPEWILKDLSLSIQKGQSIAIVGATGAGKTSVINLISRFYDYQKGEIYLDGTNIKEFELNSLRKHVGVVLQDVFLFSDSILNNITLNNPEISEEQVIEAAKIVGAHEFIEKLPNGYHYQVLERGQSLSVGQRQLIAFIRAYVYNPQILILDEATSSVDTESEELIQQAIEVLAKGRTSIIIAHRLSTIQKADKIVVLDHGKKMEEGSHTELLNHKGFYNNLYEMQFKSAVN